MKISAACVVFSCFMVLGSAPASGQGIIIDHTCNDLAQIPDSWIEEVKQDIKLFHASTSHGWQLIEGLLIIETGDPSYGVAWNWYLPTEPNALCILHQSWYEPELFFSDVQTCLDANPEINVAMYVWCGQASWYDVNLYTSEMEALEAANPEVTFVYVTGNAQEADNSGYYRYLFNETLRQYVIDNDKVLYDFADLDVWYGDEFTSETYDWDCWGTMPLIEDIPLEHPQWHGDESSHTTFESCENKGNAVWWMLARLAGWNGDIISAPGNVSLHTAPDSVHIEWDAVPEATFYKVYSSDRAYSGFAEDNSGSFGSENWSAGRNGDFGFYYLTACAPDLESPGSDTVGFIARIMSVGNSEESEKRDLNRKDAKTLGGG